MTRLQLVSAAVLCLGGAFAHADPCKITIEGNDMMQYNLKEVAVPTTCTDIEVTLRHSGQMSAKVMGHDWVLARSSDMSGIVSAALAAGPKRGYFPENDARIIVATKVIGGGESATVKFSSSALREGEEYAFFCTSPGHSTLMRGRFLFGDAKRVARAR